MIFKLYISKLEHLIYKHTRRNISLQQNSIICCMGPDAFFAEKCGHIFGTELGYDEQHTKGMNSEPSNYTGTIEISLHKQQNIYFSTSSSLMCLKVKMSN